MNDTTASAAAMDLLRHLIDAKHYDGRGNTAANQLVLDYKTLKVGILEAYKETSQS